MGEESAVSGMSEISTADQSTAQGSQSADQGKRRLIAFGAVLLIAGIVAALFISGTFGSHGSSETSTVDDDAPSSPSGGGGGVGPSPPGNVEPSETATVPPTNAPESKLLMCTTRYPGTGNDPPPGLCDIVVYDAAKSDLTSSPPAEVGFFVNYCKKRRSACGLNVEFPAGVLEQLDAPETKKVMKDFYTAGIKNYGLLRSEITRSSKADDVKDQVNLLKKLKTFMKTTGDDRDILFWGVSPVLIGGSSPLDSMVQVFLEVLKSTSVNMVVYQTTYAKNGTSSEPGCLSSGPAMWTSAPFPTQPTFVDALRFWKAVRAHPLPGVKDMLAIMLCGWWTQYKSKAAKPEFGVKTNCKATTIGYIENYICTGGARATSYLVPGTLLKDSQQYVTTAVSKEWTVGYDTNDTIVQKMCMASVKYGYDGGWVVHGLQCHFKRHCLGKDVGGFPRVREVNDSMQQEFTKCDYTH